MADEFNHFFTNVSSDMTKKIPITSKSPLAYLSNPNLESFFVSPCALNEVSAVIQSLKNRKSSGPNSIPIKLLKVLVPCISVTLSSLNNEPFKTSTLPDMLKIDGDSSIQQEAQRLEDDTRIFFKKLLIRNSAVRSPKN